MRVREVSRVKMAKFQHLLHLAISIRFMQNEFKKQLLQQNVQMDGSINFNMNGNILIVPCPWEDEKQVTDGECVSYEGGIKVEPSGLTRVTRWKRGSRGPLHDTLFETAHGAVKMTRPQIRPGDGYRRMTDEFVYVTFKTRLCLTLKQERRKQYGNDFGAIDSTQRTSD